MSDLRKIAEDAVAGIGPDAEDVIDAAREDTAQAVAIEREAIAAYLLIEARSYAHHVGDALTAEEASGSFSALMIAAQAIRNGEHVKP